MTLEMLFQVATRPMQGPLTSAQEQKLEMLKFTPYDGKALAYVYESEVRRQS